jgi:hypothetical protein
MSRSPGKSGDVISAKSRSSNSESCNGPSPRAKAWICGARRHVIQSRLETLRSSRILVAVIMPRSPTNTTRLIPKRNFILSIWDFSVVGSALLPSNTSIAIGSPSRVQSSP